MNELLKRWLGKVHCIRLGTRSSFVPELPPIIKDPEKRICIRKDTRHLGEFRGAANAEYVPSFRNNLMMASTIPSNSFLHWSILGLGAFLYSYPTELLRILRIAKLVFLVSKRGGVF